jgi:hypothetical protein
MLDDISILSSDATVIAGLLVFLTIIYASAQRSPDEIVGIFGLRSAINLSRLLIATIVIFSASAILVTPGDLFSSTAGKYVMALGFAALAAGISWLVWSEANRRFIRVQRG